MNSRYKPKKRMQAHSRVVATSTPIWVSEPSPSLKTVTIKTSGTTAMSCISRIPKAWRPCTLSISARATNRRSTTAVLLSVTIAPMVRARGTENPKNIETAAVSDMVTTTCAVPPASAASPKPRNLCHENSRPMVNSSIATPNSASPLTSVELLINCRALGPTRVPAAR